MVKRKAIPAIVWAFATLGWEVGGFTSLHGSALIWSTAIALLIWYLLTWPPIQNVLTHRIASERRAWLLSALIGGLSAYLLWPSDIELQLAQANLNDSYAGVLVAGDVPMLNVPENCKPPRVKSAVWIDASKSLVTSATDWPITLEEGWPPLTINKKDKQLLLSAKIYDGDGHLLALIEDNEWRAAGDGLPPDDIDPSTLAIYDRDGEKIFSVHYLNPDVLSITRTCGPEKRHNVILRNFQVWVDGTRYDGEECSTLSRKLSRPEWDLSGHCIPASQTE